MSVRRSQRAASLSSGAKSYSENQSESDASFGSSSDSSDGEEESSAEADDAESNSNDSADPFALSDSEIEQQRKKPAIPRSFIEDCDRIRLASLSRHRKVLRPFVTDKVFAKLEDAVDESKSRMANTRARVLDDAMIEIVHQQPKSIVNCTMRQYQLEGLNWLIQQYDQRINSVLGDEMGLGKTLQSIAFASFLVHVRKLKGPLLFIVPLTVMFNWMNEFKKFCPTMRVLRMHSNDPEEQSRLIAKMKDLSSTDAVVTTYEGIKQGGMSKAIRRQVWRAIFLDEGHRIRNDETIAAKACASLATVFKVVLSGTPLQNNLKEAGAILKFLAPNVFTDLSLFEKAFNLTEKLIDRDLLNKAHYMMRPFMLRRIKSEVEQKLPPKLETKIDCPMTDVQKELTQFLLFRERSTLERMERMRLAQNGDGNAIRSKADRATLVGLLAHLRKAANHPYLFEGFEDVDDPLGRASQDIIDASGKMQVLDKLLKRLHDKGHRVVLFSQYVRTLDIICDYLEYRGYKYQRLDGSTNRVMREVRISLFNRKNSEYFIFCLSTRAGGEGVNLFTADTVILFDSDWNPQSDIQAMARVHRIGQTKTVHIYRLVAVNSVEEMIVHRAQKKLFLDSMVNRGSTAQGKALDTVDSDEERQSTEDNDDDGDDDGDDNKRPRKKARVSSKSSNDGDSDNEAVAESDEEEADGPKPSKIFEVLKFGWQSIFAPKTENAKHELRDEDIDTLIDRTRGLPGSTVSDATIVEANAQESRKRKRNDAEDDEAHAADAAPAAAASETAETTTSIEETSDVAAPLIENQQQNVLKYDENEPLASISSLRVKYFTDFEAKVQAEQKANTDTTATITDQTVEDVALPFEETGRGKRKRESRTQLIHLEGVGEIQVLKHNDLQSLASYGHRNDPSSNQSKNIMREFLVQLREKRHREQALANGGTMVGADKTKRNREKEAFVVLEGKGRQVAGRDFQHEDVCQVCWDGGLLILCDLCPCSYHADCLGFKKQSSKGKKAPAGNDLKRFACPHHACHTCHRSSSAAGLLFRCEHCERAYCEDCVPPESEIIGECQRFQQLGYRTPSSACYIRCSYECQQHDPDMYINAEAVDESEESDESEAETSRSKKAKAVAAVSTSSSERNSNGDGPDVVQDTSAMDVDGAVAGDNNSSGAAVTASVPTSGSTSSTQVKSRFDVEMALQNCALPDIRQRLSRDEDNLGARFINLAEVPNIATRFQAASGVAKIALRNLLFFVAEQNRAVMADLSSEAVSTSGHMELPSTASSLLANGQEDLEFLTSFVGIHAAASTQRKTDIFFRALKMLAPIQRHTLPQIAQILGLCSPHFIRKVHTAPPSKWVAYVGEPKFTFNIGASVARGILEESIAAFLVVLSPLNMLVPNSKDRGFQVALTMSYEAPVDVPKRVNSKPSKKDGTGNHSPVPPTSTENGDGSNADNANVGDKAEEDDDDDEEDDEDDKSVEMMTVTVSKRFDGMLFTTRLLQSLGECAADENNQYFTAMALFELGLPGLQMFRVHNPSADRPEPAQKLAWIWPVIRIFRRMLTDDTLKKIVSPLSSRTPPTQANRALVSHLQYRSPSHQALMDIDSPNLIAYLIQGVQIMVAIRIHHHRRQLAAQPKEIAPSSSAALAADGQTASTATAAATEASTTAVAEESISLAELAERKWKAEQQAGRDDTPFQPTLQSISEAASNMHRLFVLPASLKAKATSTVGSTSATATTSASSSQAAASFNGATVNNASGNNNILAVTFRLLSCRVEFSSWVTKSKNPMANLTSACVYPSDLLTATHAELLYLLLWLVRDFDLLQRVQVDVDTLCKSLDLAQAIDFMKERIQKEYAPRPQSGFVANQSKKSAQRAHALGMSVNGSNSRGSSASSNWRSMIPVETRNAMMFKLFELFQAVNTSIETHRQRIVRQKVGEVSTQHSTFRLRQRYGIVDAPPPPGPQILDIPNLDDVRCRLQVYELALLCVSSTQAVYESMDTLYGRVEALSGMYASFIRSQYRQRQGSQALVMEVSPATGSVAASAAPPSTAVAAPPAAAAPSLMVRAPTPQNPSAVMTQQQPPPNPMQVHSQQAVLQLQMQNSLMAPQPPVFNSATQSLPSYTTSTGQLLLRSVAVPPSHPSLSLPITATFGATSMNGSLSAGSTPRDSTPSAVPASISVQPMMPGSMAPQPTTVTYQQIVGYPLYQQPPSSATQLHRFHPHLQPPPQMVTLEQLPAGAQIMPNGTIVYPVTQPGTSAAASTQSTTAAAAAPMEQQRPYGVLPAQTWAAVAAKKPSSASVSAQDNLYFSGSMFANGAPASATTVTPMFTVPSSQAPMAPQPPSTTTIVSAVAPGSTLPSSLPSQTSLHSRSGNSSGTSLDSASSAPAPTAGAPSQPSDAPRAASPNADTNGTPGQTLTLAQVDRLRRMQRQAVNRFNSILQTRSKK